MTKSKKKHENEPPELLEPVSVTQTESGKAKELSVNVPPGYVYIIGLQPDGTEKEGSGLFSWLVFFISIANIQLLF